MPLRSEQGYLPDLDAIPPSTWKRTALFWINYPHNPTGALAPREFFQRAVTLCREHGVLLASDEAYADIYYGEPPMSALECGTDNVIAVPASSMLTSLVVDAPTKVIVTNPPLPPAVVFPMYRGLKAVEFPNGKNPSF